MECIINYKTQRGESHPQNEDYIICDDKCIIIADGMGGESCGEVASQLAAKTIREYLDKALADNPSDYRNHLLKAIELADNAITGYVDAHPDSYGMGTTVLVQYVTDGTMHLAWCGDSRCFLFDKTQGLRSLTKDHSYVQELIDKGDITEEESFSHPDSNLITRFVGGGKEMCSPEYVSHELREGDLVIMCSDGLSGYCQNKEIENTVMTTDHDDLSKSLLNLALKHGSNDDITICCSLFSSKSTSKSWFKRLFS